MSEAMHSSSLLKKAFLALAIACAVAVVILINIAGAGLLVRMLVYAFLAGLFTSGTATVHSTPPGSSIALQRICSAVFGAYALTAIAVVVWVVAAKPAFG